MNTYKTAYRYENENYSCVIEEHDNGYVAIFTDKLDGGYQASRYDTIKECGEMFMTSLDYHYQEIVPQYDLGLNNWSTRQLEAEDAIDTFVGEN